MPPARPPLDVLVGVGPALLTLELRDAAPGLGGAAMMPPLCAHHASVYRTRATAIRHLPHGHKALAREARLIAAQCPACPNPKPWP